MSNYLNHLVARSLNLIDTVQPLLVSVFEPQPESVGLVEEADFNREQLPVTDTSEENNFETERQTWTSTAPSIEQPLEWRSPATLSIPDTDLYTTGSASLNIEPHSVTTDIFDPNENRYNLQTPDELNYPRALDLTPTPDRDSGQLPTSTSELAELANSELSPSQPLSESVVIPPALERELPTPDRQPLMPAIEPETNASLASPAAESQQQPAPELSQKRPIEINLVVSSSDSSEGVSSEPSSSQLRPELVVIQPATDAASSPAPNKQPLTPAIEPETNTFLASFGIGLQQQPVPELLQKQPIEINRVVFSSPSPEVISSQLSPSQSRSEPIEILPATDRVSPTLDRQLLTGAIAQETHATFSSFSAQQQQQPVPKSEKQQSIEINRVVSLLQTSHESGWQLSPTQPRPEPVVLQLTTDTERMPPSPDRQPLTGAIALETNASLTSPAAEPQQKPVPELSQKQPIEINQVAFSCEPSQVVSSLQYPSPLQPHPVVIPPATERVQPALDRQPLTPAIEAQTNVALSPTTRQLGQPVPELLQKQPIEINRIVFTSDSSEVVSRQPSSSQPQPESVVIPSATNRMPLTPDRQLLMPVIAQETPAAVSSFSTQQQQQPVPKSEKQQSVEINRVVSLLQTSHESGWQLSSTQPQPEPLVIQPTTDMERMPLSPDRQPLTGAIAQEIHAAVSSFSAQQHQQLVPESQKQQSIEINRVVSLLQTSHQSNWQLSPSQSQPQPVVIQPTTDTQRVLPSPDRQPLTGAIASETLVTPSSLGAEQQRQTIPESSQKRPIEINRVVSSSHSLQVVSRQASPSQPQSEPGAIQQEGRRQKAKGRRIFSKADGSSLVATDREQGFESPNWSSGSSSGGVQSPFEENLLPSASLLLPSELSVTPRREPTELAAAGLSAIPTSNLTGQPAIASVVVQPEISFSSSKLPNFRRQKSRTRDEGSTSSEFTEIPRLLPTQIPLWIDEISQHNLSVFDIAPMRFGRDELPQRESSSNSATPQTVQVTIGRLEIRATPPPAPHRPKPRPAPTMMSLDEYLRRRAGGGKR